jgi:hypothetical protein
VIPDQDSVAEVKVSSSSWDAEYGRVGGALVQIQTKSGTNAVHGSVFDFLRNNATNARDSFTNPNRAPPYKWNQFGGSLGGPIKKDKTFLFGDYQGTRNHLGNGFIETVPTAAMRSGDFSQLVDSSGKQIPIFDPQTGNPDGSGRTQFAGNMIPANRFSSVGVNLMALLPAPTVAYSEVNNYINSAVTKFNTNQYTRRPILYPKHSFFCAVHLLRLVSFLSARFRGRGRSRGHVRSRGV